VVAVVRPEVVLVPVEEVALGVGAGLAAGGHGVGAGSGGGEGGVWHLGFHGDHEMR
jgi:uncharacterized spore protein YtfJ